MLWFFVIVAPVITLNKVSTTDWWQVNALHFQTLWVSMHLNFREKEEEKLCCERCHRCGNQVGTKSSLCVSLLYAIFCTQTRFGDLVHLYEWDSMQHGHWGPRPLPFQSSKTVGYWRQHVKRAVLVMPSIHIHICHGLGQHGSNQCEHTQESFDL